MQHGGIEYDPGLDDRALMALAGAVIAQAAMDHMCAYQHRPVSGELPALEFLEAAGLVERAAEIVRYSPMLSGRQRPAVGQRVQRVAA
jgi:hypothetical protein